MFAAARMISPGSNVTSSGDTTQDGAPATKLWIGHEPATATALMSIFERASAGASDLSDLERNFATACELWAAAASGELPNRLRANPASSLRDASEAFRHVGAHAAAIGQRRRQN